MKGDKIMRNTRTNKVNRNHRNQSVTMNDVIVAKRNQFMKLRDHALRNDQYFLAEYYENMGKATK